MKEQRTLTKIFYYAGVVLLTNAWPFITLPLFTRFLSPADFGLVALSAAFGAFASGLVHLGLSLAYQRNYFNYRDDVRSQGALLYSTLAFVALNSLIWGSIIFIGRDFFSQLILQKPGLGYVLCWDFIACCLISFSQYFLTYFQNVGEAKTFSKFSMIQIMTNAALSITLVCGLNSGFMGIIYAKLVAALLLNIALLGYFLKILPLGFNWPILTSNLKLALPLMARFFTKPLIVNFDKWLINAMNGLSVTGVYSIAQKFSYVGFAGMGALEQVFIPKTMEMMVDLKKEGAKAVADYLMPFCYFSLCICLGIALFSEEVIRLLLPVTFYEAINITTVLGLYYGILFFGKLPHFMYSGKTLWISGLSFLNVGLMVVLCWLCVPLWGALGAAFGIFMSGFLMELISFPIRQREYYVQWPYGKLVAIVGLFLFAGFITVGLRMMVSNYAIILVMKCGLMLMFCVAGKLLGCWNMQQLAMLKSKVTKKFGLS